LNNIWFYEPYALAKPHYECCLELMQNHLDKGDFVKYYYCRGSLHSCEANKNHDFFICVDCIARKTNGIKLLDSKAGNLQERNYLSLNRQQKAVIQNWACNFKSIDEVKEFKFEDIDIGMSVASSLISYLRDAEPDLNFHNEILNKLFKASLSVYFSFKNHFERERPDMIYVFNGRFSNIRPVVRLCEHLNIPYIVHERGSTMDKYGLFYDHLPHSPSSIQTKMFNHWKSESDKNRKVEIAKEYFLQRRKGIEIAGKAIFKGQSHSGLPEFWDISKRNVLIFNSSDDEFAAVGREFFNPLFGKQIDVLTLIKKSMKNNDAIRIILRMHPNLMNVDNNLMRRTLELAGDNFHVIPPESEIDSYRLIDESDVVVTFGSTTGVEAVFSGIPSILIGNSMYRNFHVTYNPTTPSELIELILKVVKPKPIFGALVYAYFRASFGINYRFYKPEDFTSGTFKGVHVSTQAWFSFLLKSNVVKFLFGIRKNIRV
jgi:hypothetical protein